MITTIVTAGGLEYVHLDNIGDHWLALSTGTTARWIAQERARLAGTREIVIGRIKCTDGFNMSVQANFGAYCEPRNDAGPWTHVEVGYPSAPEKLLLPWIESAADESPTATVYPYVPIEVIDTVVAMHNAAKRFADKDPEALALVDALWSEGIVTTDNRDVNEWGLHERLALTHGLALMDAFGGQP